jgi:hypothetical protein
VTVLAFAVLGTFAFAERAMPPAQLTIGNDEEGKIDARPLACLALAKEITQWDEAETQKGAREVCAARKKHVDAYQCPASEAREPSRQPLTRTSEAKGH